MAEVPSPAAPAAAGGPPRSAPRADGKAEALTPAAVTAAEAVGPDAVSVRGACVLRTSAHLASVGCAKLSGHWLLSGDEHGALAVAVAAQGFARKMADGSVALVLLNRKDSGSLTLSASWSELGLPARSECSMRDLINKKQLPKAKGSFSSAVPSHSASFVRVACG